MRETGEGDDSVRLSERRSVGKEEGVCVGERHHVTMANGLEAADGIAGKSAKGDRADELGGVTAVDVGGVRVSELDKGREKGPVQGEYRGVGTFPAQKGVGEGRRRFDVKAAGA